MSNELTSRIAMPIAPASVEQTGTTNVNVTNQDGGIVNINYNYRNGPIANSAEHMMAVQSFSKEYYQLLVTCEDDVFTDNIVTVSASRALSQHLVPPEILNRCFTRNIQINNITFFNKNIATRSHINTPRNKHTDIFLR